MRTVTATIGTVQNICMLPGSTKDAVFLRNGRDG
jgi:hypothetical protein